MPDWIVDHESHARAFPIVRHRHSNGILDAVRDRTPEVLQPHSPRRERWSFTCPGCGDVYLWERGATG
jgi:hypothetical protein